MQDELSLLGTFPEVQALQNSVVPTKKQAVQLARVQGSQPTVVLE